VEAAADAHAAGGVAVTRLGTQGSIPLRDGGNSCFRPARSGVAMKDEIRCVVPTGEICGEGAVWHLEQRALY
jgi:hypothetical protein